MGYTTTGYILALLYSLLVRPLGLQQGEPAGLP
jgi:hypothetical protein